MIYRCGKRLSIILVVGVFAFGGVSFANTTDDLKHAQQEFKQGNYSKSLELLEKVYKTMPDPKLLWNMGRCLEKMGKYEEALQRYQSVLKGKDLTEQQRKKVASHIIYVKKLWKRELIKQAKQEADKGNFKRSDLLFTRAYQIDSDPKVMKTHAQTLESGNRLQQAIVAYETFLLLTKDQQERRLVKQRVQDIKQRLSLSLLKEAASLMQEKRWADALGKLERAWGLRHDPQCLWEKARLYELKGDTKAALKWYNEYIDQAPGPQGVAAAQAKIAALHAHTADKTLVSSSPILLQKGEGPGRNITTGGYILLGTGGAVLATGIVFTLLANRDFSSLKNAKQDKEGRIIGMDQEEAADLQDTAGRERMVSWVMYGIGAAMVVTSVALIVVGHKHKSEPKAFIVPANRGVSLGLHVDF